MWHPFTQAKVAPSPIPIVKGKGAYLYSDAGEGYIDAISSWWVNLHGHAHPYISQKITGQMRDLEHVIFAGYTHPQAIILAERLLALFNGDYARVFYSDNGSTAVEVALKMAFQVKGKKLLSFQGAYHGDTFGAMAAGKSHYNKPFWPYLFEVHSIVPPLPGRETESWKEFEKVLKDVAVFIFEPMIQGAGGMRTYSSKWLAKMIHRCHEKNIITIADEVMTGFGRTNSLFACHQLPTPDLLCLSKGITGGFLPLGATLAKKFIFDSFLSHDPCKAFLHGHSYTANPLACAAANASLDLLLKPECFKLRKMIEQQHLKFQKKWQHHSTILRCDVIGTVLALEYKTNQLHLIDFFQSEGVIVRPLGNVLYLLPPYCIKKGELRKIYSLIERTL